VPSIIVLERAGIRIAVARSWSLTNRFFWRTFGVQILIAIILAVASQIISVPISLVSSIAFSLIYPTGAENANGTAMVVAVISYLVLMLVSLIVGSITSIVQSAATALIYIDLRMRKEGLDLTLVRFVENRQAGMPTPESPFAAPTANAASAPAGPPFA
jgi:hypothetical protein